METDIFSSIREFQVWGYLVSHGQLLLRSPKIKGYDENIDIIFFGVTYIQLHTHLIGLTIRKIDPNTEVIYPSVKEHLGYAEQNKLFEIVSDNETCLIVAGFVRVFENDLEFGESSLGFDEIGRHHEIARIT